MARNHGRILTGIWADQDFRSRTPEAQRFYLFLLSQPNLNHAGLLPLTLRRWAGAAAGLTVPDVQRALEELAETQFIVVDEDVEEVLVRSLVRRDGIWKQPKVMLAMEGDALEITSPKLQAALLAELDRLDLSSLSDEPPKSGGESNRKVVRGVIDRLREAFPTPSPGVSGTLSEVPPEASADTVPGTSARGESSGDSLSGDSPFSTAAGYNKPAAQKPLSAPGEPFQIGDVKGIGKGIADPHACVGARSPAPAPAPVPPSAGAVAPRDGVAPPATADQLVADWLDHIPKRPPGQVIGQVGKHIKAMLAENIDPADIRRGIAAWVTKGLHPSTLPSVVNEVMNATPLADAAPRPSRNAQIAAGFAARVAAAEAAQPRPEIRIVKGELFP